MSGLGLPEEFVRDVQENLVPRVRDATVAVLQLGENLDDLDVDWAVQLGVMIMLDKPIVVIAAPDQVLPEKLLKVADEIVLWERGTSLDELGVAIKRIAEARGWNQP